MKALLKNLIAVTKSRSIKLLLVVFIAGCASKIPEEIRSAPEGSPRVDEVRVDAERFIGTTIRWGGEIITVQNFEAHTEVEIVARDLVSSGRPLTSDNSPGRFIAIIKGFIDPTVYAEKREITVFGIVTGSLTKPIGDYLYRYPTTEVSHHVLWEPLPQRDPYYYPAYWHDPWYDPWYGPWYRHHYWRYPYRYR